MRWLWSWPGYLAAVVAVTVASYVLATAAAAPPPAPMASAGRDWSRHARYNPQLGSIRIVVTQGWRSASGQCHYPTPELPVGDPPSRAVVLERDSQTCATTWEVGLALEPLPAHDPDGR